MSKALQKLLNKPLHSRIATLFHHQPPFQFPSPPAGALSNSRFAPTLHPNSNPFQISKIDNKITNFNGFHLYPSFSFGFFLNPPISPSGVPQSKIAEVQEVDVGGDESRMIWADSVKKKRKKKMNKHKLKKLRKRLRHCS